LPDEAGPSAARDFLELLTRLGGASFLCVIKDCGPEGKGLLSFPLKGISIAVDIPVRAHTRELVEKLNRFVIDKGGRIYLAKDAFTSKEEFEKMEKRLPRFLEIRRKYGGDKRFQSAQSIRLLGDTP
jgi:FAD/FMN-containing dehydrogenase